MSNDLNKHEQARYEKLRQSAEQSGKSTPLARKIALEMVTKQRRREAPPRSGEPVARHSFEQSLERESKSRLYDRARQLNIPHRSRMNKQALVDAILNHSPGD
ncbi:MAG: Rho termination factor N-terminal domain-containing protein [Halioglobus sp.]